jgi:hypothetical protein
VKVLRYIRAEILFLMLCFCQIGFGADIGSWQQAVQEFTPSPGDGGRLIVFRISGRLGDFSKLLSRSNRSRTIREVAEAEAETEAASKMIGMIVDQVVRLLDLRTDDLTQMQRGLKAIVSKFEESNMHMMPYFSELRLALSELSLRVEDFETARVQANRTLHSAEPNDWSFRGRALAFLGFSHSSSVWSLMYLRSARIYLQTVFDPEVSPYNQMNRPEVKRVLRVLQKVARHYATQVSHDRIECNLWKQYAEGIPALVPAEEGQMAVISEEPSRTALNNFMAIETALTEHLNNKNERDEHNDPYQLTQFLLERMTSHPDVAKDPLLTAINNYRLGRVLASKASDQPTRNKAIELFRSAVEEWLCRGISANSDVPGEYWVAQAIYAWLTYTFGRGEATNRVVDAITSLHDVETKGGSIDRYLRAEFLARANYLLARSDFELRNYISARVHIEEIGKALKIVPIIDDVFEAQVKILDQSVARFGRQRPVDPISCAIKARNSGVAARFRSYWDMSYPPRRLIPVFMPPLPNRVGVRALLTN